MIFRWLQRRRQASARVLADADALLGRFRDGAYDEARRRALHALVRGCPDPHWDKVRREIGRRTGRVHLDTATRYLEP